MGASHIPYAQRTQELSKQYNQEGEAWLLQEMEKIGFLIVDGQVRAFLGEDNKAVTPARAQKEGYQDGGI